MRSTVSEMRQPAQSSPSGPGRAGRVRFSCALSATLSILRFIRNIDWAKIRVNRRRRCPQARKSKPLCNELGKMYTFLDTDPGIEWQPPPCGPWSGVRTRLAVRRRRTPENTATIAPGADRTNGSTPASQCGWVRASKRRNDTRSFVFTFRSQGE